MAPNHGPDLNLIWHSMCENIRENNDITESAFNVWLSHAKLAELTHTVATFTLENDFKREFVEREYKNIFSDRLYELIAYRPEIRFETNIADAPILPGHTSFFTYEFGPDGKTTVISPKLEEEDEKPAPRPMTGERRLTYNPDYTFENFVVGTTNQFAHAAALAVAKNPSFGERGAAMNYNPLFIYGPSGIGKTHLMYAITNRILDAMPDVNIVYVKGEEFTNQLIESIANKSTREFRDKYRRADMLLIDDVQFIAGKVSTQEEFFHTFNALYEDNKQIILTSDRPPQDMSTLEERIKTRFESGLLADIQPPDFELRLAILRSKAERVGLDISVDILNYLAENLHDNVRKIEGVIKKLSAKALLTGAAITMEMAKAEVPTFATPQQSQQDIAKQVMLSTAKKYGVTMEEILGQKRTAEIKKARNVAMYIIRRMTTFSLSEIGKLMNRDHATVHNNINFVENAMKADSYFESEVNDIIADVK